MISKYGLGYKHGYRWWMCYSMFLTILQIYIDIHISLKKFLGRLPRVYNREKLNSTEFLFILKHYLVWSVSLVYDSVIKKLFSILVLHAHRSYSRGPVAAVCCYHWILVKYIFEKIAWLFCDVWFLQNNRTFNNILTFLKVLYISKIIILENLFI